MFDKGAVGSGTASGMKSLIPDVKGVKLGFDEISRSIRNLGLYFAVGFMSVGVIIGCGIVAATVVDNYLKQTDFFKDADHFRICPHCLRCSSCQQKHPQSTADDDEPSAPTDELVAVAVAGSDSSSDSSDSEQEAEQAAVVAEEEEKEEEEDEQNDESDAQGDVFA